MEDPDDGDALRYRTVGAPVVARTIEKRSTFEARLHRVESEDTAREVIERVRKENWDARHHCSAFVLGHDAAIARSNDDGEPSGTAGMPMLEVLTGAQVRDVVVVVSRWFGGVLLGTGGLVRAYGGAVRAALEQATFVQRELRRVGQLRVGAADAGRVEHDLRARGVSILGVEYGAEVLLRLASPAEQSAALLAAVAEITRGEAEVAWTGEQWADADAGQ